LKFVARLRRFEAHRFVAVRSTMWVYDTDDAEQSSVLEDEVAAGDLFDRDQLQTFGPDTLAEARNRGFRPL